MSGARVGAAAASAPATGIGPSGGSEARPGEIAQANERPGGGPPVAVTAVTATARATPAAPDAPTPPRSAPARGSRRTVIASGSKPTVIVPSRSVR